MSYYDGVNPDILELVEPGRHRICELGCGAGAMGRSIRERQVADYYVGIDIAEQQLSQARQYMDVALCRNLDTLPEWSADAELQLALPLSSFDYFICGDVLEHLVNPQQVLKQIHERLKPGGVLLTSIPNVQHWSVFAQLVVGSWPQEDSGIFDRTHLRWFALGDMLSLLNNSGFTVEKYVPRVFAEDQGREIIEFMEPLAIHLGVDPKTLTRQSLPLQYVFFARKSQS